MRWASAGGVVRKARAISSVVRPQTSRRVSAMRASGARRRMTASEDQPKPVIFDGFILPLRRVGGHGLDRLGRGVQSSSASQDIDGLVAAGRNEPGSRVRGHAVCRPFLEGRAECVLHRVFGELKVAEQSDQRGEDAPRVGAVDRIDGVSHRIGVLTHRTPAETCPLSAIDLSRARVKP